MRREKMIRKGIRDVSTASTFAQYDACKEDFEPQNLLKSHFERNDTGI